MTAPDSTTPLRVEQWSPRFGRARLLTSARRTIAATAAITVALAGLTTGPAWAAEFQRDPQSFSSSPASAVGAAESAFNDTAANWSGGSSETGANTGDWTATDLSSAGSWSHGGSSGSYSYSYSVRVPPAAGPVPGLALSYSSAAHDGLTSGTNNQASWIGDGWGYSPGLIERTYTACSSEPEQDGNNGSEPTGDMCWDGDSPSITMALGGSNTPLVLDDDSGEWRASGEENWRIELFGSPASSSAATTERWKVTGTDGTQYYFASDPANAGSRWTVPVFGNHSGEACYASGDFAGSRCTQAYRWMLDKVVDVHGNMTRYVYGTETGYYSPAADSTADAVAYTRSGWLKRIEYGLRSNDAGVKPTGRVQLIADERCLSACYDASGNRKEANWPDVPWELDCKSGTGCEQHSPVFFSTKRLSEITTEVWDSTANVFDAVDSWILTHEFKDYGDTSQIVLWLSAIEHTGHVGGTASTPPVEFGATFLPNRVDDGSANPSIWRPRLTSIKNETGGVTTVNYSEPDCGEANLPTTPERNTQRCYPARYIPEGTYNPVEAYFHKYVVTSIAESDTTGGGDTVWTYYEYSTAGGGTSTLWAWNDSEFTADDQRTYNQWRGYAQVTTLVGDPADPGPQLRSVARFYRGLDGQPLPDGTERSVTLTSTQGDTATDHEALASQVWEQISYKNTTVIASSVTRYWVNNIATRAHSGGELQAWISAPSKVDSRTLLATGSWRQTRVETSYDAYGRTTAATEHGDLAVTGDEKCIRTAYNDNTSAWILDAPKSVEVLSVRCSATGSKPADLVGAVRAFYDGATSVDTPPTTGLMTRSETVEDWDSGPVWTVLAESTFDAIGRELTATDALGNATLTDYTPSGPGPVTSVTSTNALGHVTSASYEPAWGAALQMVSANNQVTTVTYDPLGRRTAVWLPGQDHASGEAANLRFRYKISQSEPSATTTETMIWNQSYLTEIQIFDALMRPRQTQATTYSGRLLTQTEYNSYGQATYASGANFNNESGPTDDLMRISRSNDVARTEYVYDDAGRVTDEIYVVKDEERWRTTTVYGGNPDYWQTMVIPPNGGITRATLEDARGNTVELREYHGHDASGAYDATAYTYNPDGQLNTVTAPDGLNWSFEYDLRGRRTTAHDPDTGTSTTVYNTAGQVISTTDANGATLSYEYDALGRTTARWEGAVDTGTLLSEWSYDGALAYGKGRPYKSTNWIDGQAWTHEYRRYDVTGQPTQVLTYLPAAAGSLSGTYYQAFTYHPDGNVKTSVANATAGLKSETMAYAYNEMGQPSRVTSTSADFGAGKVYVDQAVYSPYGQLLQRRLGDPADVGGTSGQVWQTWIYEEGTGRLAEFYFDKDTAGEFDGTNYGIAALSYEYDQAGSILSITDQPVHNSDALQPETQCFQYDHLNRLAEAWAQAGASDCAATPTESSVGGPGAYWSTYEYDVSGNRTSETRLTMAGRLTDTYTYETGSHALNEVATVENGGERDVYTYDQAGNAASIDRAGDLSLLDWVPTGRLNSVSNGEDTTWFFDDAEGSRLARVDPDGNVTAWVAGYELRYNKVANTVEAVRYYSHGGEVIAERIGKGDVLFVSGDHHGTGQWIVNGGTLTATVRRFDPFGNERGLTQGNWPDQRGFVGGIDNQTTGLTTLGAREYDPSTGRFVSVDPIAAFNDPQQLNGYAYANNSPANMSDATGLCATGPSVLPGTWQGPCAPTTNTPSGSGNEGTGTSGSASDDDIWDDWEWGGGDGLPNGAPGCERYEASDDPWGKCAPPLPDNPAIEEDPFLFYAYCAEYGYAKDHCEWLGNSALGLSFADSSTADMIFNELTGLGDLEGCMEGDGSSCAWLLVGFIPGGKLAKWADEAGSWVMKLVTKSCNSFVAGTLVLMADGTTKPIEEVEPGEEVLSVDTLTGETVSAAVADTMTTPEQFRNLVAIGIDSNRDGTADSHITATAGHAFWSTEQGLAPGNSKRGTWTLAQDLQAGSSLQTYTGRWIQAADVQSQTAFEGTHNLAISSTHTYFIASAGLSVLTHNCGGIGDDVYDELQYLYGDNVAAGVDYNFQRMCGTCNSSADAASHSIDGIGSDPRKLAEYLSGFEGNMTHSDPSSSTIQAAYDHEKGVVIIQNGYMIHAYHMEWDKFTRRFTGL